MTEEKKVLDGWSTSSPSAIRDIILAQPICPKSQIRGKIVNGNYEPPEIGPDDMNCQLFGKGWWERCEEKGHRPYEREVKVYRTVDETEVDADGVEWVIGSKRKVERGWKLNATSISPQMSHNSGIGVGIKIRDHGFRRISDFGYAEACQYGGCQRPVLLTASTGDFCSEEHMVLVEAKAQGVFLANNPQGTYVDADKAQQIKQYREKQLREVMPRNVRRVAE